MEKEPSKKYSSVLITFHEVTLKIFKNFLIPRNWLNLQEYKLQFTLVFYEFPKLRAMRVSVPTCLVFQLSVSTCQKACQFFKYSPYEMLSEISILYYYIKNYTWYHSYAYDIHFYNSCHIKENFVKLSFFTFFSLLLFEDLVSIRYK